MLILFLLFVSILVKRNKEHNVQNATRLRMDDEITKLKIIHVNDVYELDNFSKLATCKQIESQSDKTIAVLAGDFLAPSLLSCIDKGNGMVECMNASGIDYICLGNHEGDINIEHIHQRIRQSKFEWINSNIPDFPLPNDLPKLPEYKIIEISNKSNKNTRKIALLGLCCDEMGTMSAGSFANFTIENVNNKVKLLYDHLVNNEKVDLVIPLTHQDIKLDRKLAEMNFGLSLILGGHDHTLFHENINDCQILKVGVDATKFGIVSIVWNHESDTKPKISIDVKDASIYTNDTNVDQIVHKHESLLTNLKNAHIYEIPKCMTFSTKLIRYKQKNVGTFLSTIVRKELKLDCVLLNAGSIRGDYDLDGDYFSYADLIKTLPFETVLSIIELPGKIIQDIIAYTRRFSYQEQQLENPSFIQTDDGISFESHSSNIININNNTIQYDHIYKCGMLLVTINGMNEIVPLLDYVKTLPTNVIESIKNEENCKEVKLVVLSFFSKHILWGMILSLGGFDGIDDNHDNKVFEEELIHNIITKSVDTSNEDQDFYKLLIGNFFDNLDINKDASISREEIENLLNLPDLNVNYSQC